VPLIHISVYAHIKNVFNNNSNNNNNNNNNNNTHSGHFHSASSSPLLFRGVPDYSMNTVSEFHAEAQTTVSKGLTQGPYVAAGAGVEPTTLRLRVIDLTNAPPHPT